MACSVNQPHPSTRSQDPTNQSESGVFENILETDCKDRVHLYGEYLTRLLGDGDVVKSVEWEGVRGDGEMCVESLDKLLSCGPAMKEVKGRERAPR